MFKNYFIYAINYTEAVSIAQDYLPIGTEWQYLFSPDDLHYSRFRADILLSKNCKQREDWEEIYDALILDKHNDNRFQLRFL